MKLQGMKSLGGFDGVELFGKRKSKGLVKKVLETKYGKRPNLPKKPTSFARTFMGRGRGR